VTAIDDLVAEGTHAALITHVATSADRSYDGFVIPDVAVTITDNDAPDVHLRPTGSGTAVQEDGPTSDTYTVALGSKPAAEVMIHIQPDAQVDLGAGAGGAVDLAFGEDDWDTPQPVVVTAVDDAVREAAHVSNLTHTATSADPYYDALAIQAFVVTVVDDDVEGVLITETADSTAVAEDGLLEDGYFVRLESEPIDIVLVTVSPGEQLDVGRGPGTDLVLTFGPADWNVAQGVAVSAFDDRVAEGPHAGVILHSASSEDPNYDGLAAGGTGGRYRGQRRAGPDHDRIRRLHARERDRAHVGHLPGHAQLATDGRCGNAHRTRRQA
jgi:hypothetical protein